MYWLSYLTLKCASFRNFLYYRKINIFRQKLDLCRHMIVSNILTLCCVISGPTASCGGAEVPLCEMVDPRQAGVVFARLRAHSFHR